MSLENKKILVTGGAGFIGSNIIEYLLQKKNKITCLDNLITGKKENIEIFLDDPNFKFIEGDITNFDDCDRACKGNNIILSISDQGSGMSKQVQKRIFEKFYREHSGDVHNVKGHGLGLAYVKRIIKEHNAEILVESEKGRGSKFSIIMPLNPK